ncbi:MAG: hypothetical protein QOD93_1582, partial [Acetobacteraceae bacterium]|nr:hypothetical protein [Acetobacteraceae bacterium]
VHGNRDRIWASIGHVLAGGPRSRVDARIVGPTGFAPSQPLELTLVVANQDIETVRLHYRHVNQAEVWQVAEATAADGAFSASIPAAYTATAFPLQYYFELRGAQRADLFPGLSPDLANQPYVVARRNPLG